MKNLLFQRSLPYKQTIFYINRLRNYSFPTKKNNKVAFHSAIENTHLTLDFQILEASDSLCHYHQAAWDGARNHGPGLPHSSPS